MIFNLFVILLIFLGLKYLVDYFMTLWYLLRGKNGIYFTIKILNKGGSMVKETHNGSNSIVITVEEEILEEK